MRLALGMLCFFALLGCNPRNTGSPAAPANLSEKEKAAAAEALKALGRIEAAIEVGINYQKYSELLVEAKAAANEAERTLPASELRTKIAETMQAYEDAGEAWKDKITWSKNSTVPQRIGEKYGVAGKSDDEAMQRIWSAAAAKLAEARKLQ